MFLIVSCMLSNIHYKSFRFWVNNRTSSALNKYIYIYILNQCTLASPQVFLIHLCINTLNNQGDIIHPSYFCSKLNHSLSVQFILYTVYLHHTLLLSHSAINFQLPIHSKYSIILVYSFYHMLSLNQFFLHSFISL